MSELNLETPEKKSVSPCALLGQVFAFFVCAALAGMLLGSCGAAATITYRALVGG